MLLALLAACTNAHTCADDGVISPVEVSRTVDHEGQFVTLELMNPEPETAYPQSAEFEGAPPFAYTIGEIPSSIAPDESAPLLIQSMVPDDVIYLGKLLLDTDLCGWSITSEYLLTFGGEDSASGDTADTGSR